MKKEKVIKFVRNKISQIEWVSNHFFLFFVLIESFVFYLFNNTKKLCKIIEVDTFILLKKIIRIIAWYLILYCWCHQLHTVCIFKATLSLSIPQRRKYELLVSYIIFFQFYQLHSRFFDFAMPKIVTVLFYNSNFWRELFEYLWCKTFNDSYEIILEIIICCLIWYFWCNKVLL